MPNLNLSSSHCKLEKRQQGTSVIAMSAANILHKIMIQTLQQWWKDVDQKSNKKLPSPSMISASSNHKCLKL